MQYFKGLSTTRFLELLHVHRVGRDPNAHDSDGSSRSGDEPLLNDIENSNGEQSDSD